MNHGLTAIIVFFGLFHFLIIIGFLLDRNKLKKIAIVILNMMTELIFELGKTLVMAGVIGMYFIPETKDFTKALISGIIFFVIGYIIKNRRQ